MQEFELAKKILDDILDNGTSFNEALRKVFQADVSLRPLRPLVAGLVGCELRHHLLFKDVLSKVEGLNENEMRYSALALGDLYFVKRINKETMVEALKGVLGDKITLLDALIENSDHAETLISPELSKSSNKYLSLRYNTPEWVLKIWEHYGFGVTYKILKKNNRPGLETVRVRTSKISVESVLNNNKDFALSPVSDMLLYGGKTPLRKIEAYRTGDLFSERLLTKSLLDQYKISEPMELFCYSGNKDASLLKEIIETYGNKVGINLGVPSLEEHMDVTAMIRRDNLKNVNFFEGNVDSFESAISRPQDLVIAAPNSSNFDLVREEPDFLLHFKKDEMDALFKQEKDVLENASKFVAEGGTLIYMIYTISKKEGHQTIASFLANHPEFQLVNDRQAYPFEEMDTAMYYAILRKDSFVKKDAIEKGPLFAAKEKESVAASLESN